MPNSSFDPEGLASSSPDRVDRTFSCTHCGLPATVENAVWAQVAGLRKVYCCQGCATVAALLIDSEASPAPSASPQNLSEEEMRIEGMHCAACARAIELGLLREVGVHRARVDPISQRLIVSFDDAATSLSRLIRATRRLGYRLYVPGAAAEKSLRRAALGRLLLALLCMMQVMMLSVPSYLAGPDDIAPDVMQLFRLAQFALALPVILYSALPFYRAASRDLRLARWGMDVTVSLGIAVATLASVVAVVQGSGAVYFDSITMFVAFLLGSRWLQEQAMRRASEHLDALTRTAVSFAHRIEPGGGTQDVRVTALLPGARILVRPGETFPIDGRIVAGAGSCSEALLHGESRPVPKQVGSEVLAGAINLEEPLEIEVERVGPKTVLAALARIAAEAGRERPELVRFADRAAQCFAAVLVVLAAAAAFIWSRIDAARIIPVEVAILVVTCPCALALAVPLALAAGQAAMARLGVLVTRSAAIETLGRVDTVLFDKTGTLTRGQMSLKEVRVLPGAGISVERALCLATTLEEASNHPMAAALRRACPQAGLVASGLRHASGVGIAGTIEGVDYTLGRTEETLAKLELELPAQASLAILSRAGSPLALLVFADLIRPSAAGLIAHLEAEGCEVRILSGDRAGVVARVAGELHIAQWQAGMQPKDKLDAVHALQRARRVVAMVGDGLNDAAAIAGADTSVAFASGSTITQTRADFIVLSDDLGAVRAALEIARQTRRIVRQSLGWALAYNLVAIPVAASGSIAPQWAALGMAASSLAVVANAMRLLRRPRVREL